jgi:hypothetical protein
MGGVGGGVQVRNDNLRTSGEGEEVEVRNVTLHTSTPPPLFGPKWQCGKRFQDQKTLLQNLRKGKGLLEGFLE